VTTRIWESRVGAALSKKLRAAAQLGLPDFSSGRIRSSDTGGERELPLMVQRGREGVKEGWNVKV